MNERLDQEEMADQRRTLHFKAPLYHWLGSLIAFNSPYRQFVPVSRVSNVCWLRQVAIKKKDFTLSVLHVVKIPDLC